MGIAAGSEASRHCFLQEQDEDLLEHDEVLVHLQPWIAADEAADRIHAEQSRRIKHASRPAARYNPA